jgi:uncharacterized protein (TIGR00251 family)
VRLTPRTSRDEIVGERGGELAVKVGAPPLDGRANTALRRLVAKAVGIPPRRVQLVRGEKGRSKVLRLEGLSAAAAARRLP